MQNRSNRGSGKPVWVRVHYQPALMIGTRPKRIALGPAAHRPQQQAGHMTALDQFAAKIHLAKTEPSTHDPKRTQVSVSVWWPQLGTRAKDHWLWPLTPRIHRLDVHAPSRIHPNWTVHNRKRIFGWIEIDPSGHDHGLMDPLRVPLAL